MQKTATD